MISKQPNYLDASMTNERNSFGTKRCSPQSVAHRLKVTWVKMAHIGRPHSNGKHLISFSRLAQIVLLGFCLVGFCGNAVAEYCWTSGCANMVGYIFIPITQYWTKRGGVLSEAASMMETIGLGINATEFTIKKSADWLFEQPGLPTIDSSVTLMIGSRLMSLDEVQNNTNALSQPFLIIDRQRKWVSPTVYDLVGAFQMHRGTILRILGYYVIGGPDATGNQLFAIVQVLRDGR